MNKKQERLFTLVGIIIIIALSIGLVKLNLKYKEENITEAENLEVNIEDDEEINIPPIKALKDIKDTKIDDINKHKDDNPNYPDVPEYKEEVVEKEENKVLIKSTPAPKKEKTPEGMKKPESKPKPEEPPKLAENADTKNPEEPPTYEKQEEESSIIEKDGKRYIKGVNGKLFPIENNTDTLKGGEVNGSDLLDDGEVAGEGDKF